jgi:hypothetical protein
LIIIALVNWNISIAYPWWFVLLCLLVGVLYASLLYYKSKDAERFSDYRWVQIVLPFLRFVLGSALAFLLLGPMLKYAGFQTQKPIVALLIDDSKSITEKDLTTAEIAESMGVLTEELEQKFEVNTVGYSDVSKFTTANQFTHQGSETNMSQALRYVREQYVNQNLGAIVLLSDGIYNAGSNPRFIAQDYKVPIYTIGVGDTTVYADLKVNNVTHNSLAYLGNEFPFRVEIKADKLKGKQVNMQILLNGNTLEQKSIVISKDAFFTEVDVIAKAAKLGQNKVEIRLSTFDNEKNKSNNVRTFYVDVIDGKKKVALWASAPHPDLGMLRTTINSNENYEANIFLSGFEVNGDYDLVVLHNWFATQAQLNLYEKLRVSGVPTLVIAGNQFNARIFNAGSQETKFVGGAKGLVQALPVVSGEFEYFDIDASVVQTIKKWPPLRAPFGKYKGYATSDVVLYQQIGSVTTQEPLMLLANEGNLRFGLIAGTGLWQWRMADYEQNQSHDNVNELINNVVQYLAVKEQKKLLNVYSSAKQYGVGERVTLLGELYNQSLDAISGQEININLRDAAGKVYKHTMTASGDQYRLQLNNLEAGAYQYTATTTVGGAKLKDNSYFTVLGQQKELTNLTADFDLLRNIAQTTGGAFTPFTDVDALGEKIVANSDLKSLITEENKLDDLIKMKWLFWLLFGLLGLEWFVRKWAGGY